MLCRLYLVQIQSAPLEPMQIYSTGPLSDLVDDLMHYAHESEIQTSMPQTALLDEMSLVYKFRF